MYKIVVGMDGSAGSRAAMDWAIEQAKFRDGTIELAMAYHDPVSAAVSVMPSITAPMDLEDSARREVERQARAALERWTDAATAAVGRPATGVFEKTSPVELLMARAEDADLLVVGARGHGGFMGLHLGAVSTQIAHHAPCPVVIIPRDD